ncbi:hypothetical protein Dimus_001321 [Dionaea muscipula]
MPRYYCDYCDTYLTHDSPSVRKQHNAGYKHKANVRNYYQQFEEQQTQSLIDQRIKEHLGQAAAYQQVGTPFAVWQRGRPPILATPPILPIPGPVPVGASLVPPTRPPVLPRPLPVPGVASGFGAGAIPGPVGLLTGLRATNGPPLSAISAPATVPSSTANPASGGQPMYRGIPSSGGFAAAPGTLSFQNASGSTGQAPGNADGFPYPQPQASSTGH